MFPSCRTVIMVFCYYVLPAFQVVLVYIQVRKSVNFHAFNIIVEIEEAKTLVNFIHLPVVVLA